MKIVFVNKRFDELTRQDVESMRDTRVSETAKEIIDHYGVDINTYISTLRDLGLRATREERKLIPPYIPQEPPDILNRREMMAIRLFRGFSRQQLAKKWRTLEEVIKSYELSRSKVPIYIQRKYMSTFKIQPSELKRIQLALAGKVTKVEELREIPQMIKDEVYKKYEGKCNDCGANEHLHIHHKKHFSKGGLHTLDNLELLCVGCHAVVHKGDKAYHMLLAIAERMGVHPDGSGEIAQECV
jgi:hypothetical protein